MYVIRAIFRTGQTLDFNFEDVGTATEALKEITRGRTSKTPVQILDTAGRQWRFDGNDLLAEGLVDVMVEAASVLRLSVVTNEAVEAEKERLGLNVRAPEAQFTRRPVTHEEPQVGGQYAPANPKAQPRFAS